MATPVLNITLSETHNIFFLGVSDISVYPTGWNVTNPSLEITPPGWNKKTMATFTPRAMNVYKSSDLGITCGDDEECIPVPDGLYIIKYSINPNVSSYVEKTFMRVDNLRCQYGDAWLSTDLVCACSNEEKGKLKKYLTSINLLIEGSVAAANSGDCDKAYKYYQKAKQSLEHFCKSGCSCP